MAKRPNFPGMNPYLEGPSIWSEVHYGLIGALMRFLNPQVNPKYRVAVEKRVYTDAVLVGIPDANVIEKKGGSQVAALQQTAVLSKPEIVSIPMLEEIVERYLEVREVASGDVVTVIEVLSPKNKKAGEGRRQYFEKRQRLLATQTHLVEIDLLRVGKPMPCEGGRLSDYQILISRSYDRPAAARYPFNLQDSMPCFPLPLKPQDAEPVIDLSDLIEQVYVESALELAIDYAASPEPALSAEKSKWMETIR